MARRVAAGFAVPADGGGAMLAVASPRPRCAARTGQSRARRASIRALQDLRGLRRIRELVRSSTEAQKHRSTEPVAYV